jgi:hypothetical protein
MSKQTAVEWLIEQLEREYNSFPLLNADACIKALEMEKEQMLDFGDFIIDELAPMAQNREWVEERYNYFKSE